MNEKKIIAYDENIKEIIKSEILRLGINADLNHIDVRNVTDMTGLFCDSIFNGNISKWNVSSVNRMVGLFLRAEFNGDISKWDVSGVKKARAMFVQSKFNRYIGDWKFHEDLELDDSIIHVLENSYNIKNQKELSELKLIISSDPLNTIKRAL